MAALSIAVISDLHAFVDAKNSSNSSLQFGTPVLERRNPLVNLIEYVTDKDNGITADILVCPGDICNQADLQGFATAWSKLQNLKTALNSRYLISTCGNHDLNSRYLKDRGEDDPDPKGALLCLSPGFPFDDPVTNNQYWAQNFAVVELGSDCCAVVLNTSAYHGGQEDEIEHGRISKRTIDAILKELANYKDRRTFLLICHHHLMPMTNVVGTDFQYVHNGTELLDKLERLTRKSWLVIHGHRHHPRLIYGQASTSCAPIIFGSSSLGARLTGVPNQFHLISLEESNQSDHSSIVGTVRTWSWTETTGWMQAGRVNVGMPTVCGFGYKGQVGNLADEILKIVGSQYITWSEALGKLPSLNYLTPGNLVQLVDELDLRKIAVHFDHTGLPSQIAQRAS